MAIQIYSEPLWWGKIGKVANQMKLAVLSDCELLWWEKIGKVANGVKLAILNDCEPLVGKDWKNCELDEIDCSEWFRATLVGKDWKSCELNEIGCSK